MLKENLKKLSDAFECKIKEIKKDESFIFYFDEKINITFSEIENYIYMKTKLSALPEKNKEELFTHVMRANLLTQATGRSIIGIDREDKFLTLTHKMPYEVSYNIFKDKVEDFINYLLFWEKEIKSFLEKLNKSIY